jgi:glutamate/tyrosine decarboxylase-like PLP-dependent enzyme
MRRMSEQVIAEILEGYLRLPERPVGRYASRPEMEALLCRDMPEEGSDLDNMLAEVRDKVAPNAMRPSHPRFLAFVPAGPCFPALLGDWLCDGLNLFAAVWKEGAGPAQVELIVLDWFRRILGMPAEASGLLTSGGSEAILIGLVTARERLSFEERGRAVLYTSDQRHWSVDRGARIAGLRPDQIRALPTDADLRLSLDPLWLAVDEDVRAGRIPWLVLANAGTTNTGAVDSMDAIADFCAERGLWLHADAAYGWAAALGEAGKCLLRGIERADSISLDPHKWFAQTYDVGCLLVRDGAALTKTFAMQPEYLQDVQAGEDEVDFAQRGIALTRRFRALKIWLSVQVLGMGWFRRLIEHCFNLAEYAQRRLEQVGGFELLTQRQLSVVCFRCNPAGWVGDLDALNRAICAEAVRTGRVFLATTRVRGVVAQRFCFVNWRTTADDVDEVIALLADIAQRMRR